MTFSNAVAGISESSESRNATKIPQWAGYAYYRTASASSSSKSGRYSSVYASPRIHNLPSVIKDLCVRQSF